MRVIPSRNLCPHGEQRCLGQVCRVKASLCVSLQLPDRASVWTLMSPTHSVGLGCEVLRIIKSYIELSVCSLSLEELIHLKQGRSHLFSLPAFQTPGQKA